MNKKVGIALFTFLAFLLWLFFAIYYSIGNEWWTVMTAEQTSSDTVKVSMSPIRVLIGAGVFLLIGILLVIVGTRK